MKPSFVLGALAVFVCSMGIAIISHRFGWPPLVGLAAFCTGTVAAFSACWWMMFPSTPAGGSEVADAIAKADATADSRMHDIAMDTAMRHLRGEYDQAGASRKILDVLLAPAEVRAAFQATYGTQFDDPGMANARAQWEQSWVTAKLNSSTAADPGFKPHG